MNTYLVFTVLGMGPTRLLANNKAYAVCFIVFMFSPNKLTLSA